MSLSAVAEAGSENDVVICCFRLLLQLEVCQQRCSFSIWLFLCTAGVSALPGVLLLLLLYGGMHLLLLLLQQRVLL